MKNKSQVILALLFLSVANVFAQEINTSASRIDFSISNFKVNTVEGFFNGMSGIIQFDESNLSSSSFDVCIAASTVNTDNEKRDKHLKNEDFFEVEKYPTICFVSDEIIKKGDQYITKGRLTLHGVTQEVSIPFTKNESTLVGDLKINRLDYDLGKGTGTFTVGDEVEIKITCVLN
ncbi:YceI family protein [Flammeovirga agarivorans]|uniref:YceI family protein n=1 Tax=Flammeovirga agarivorans TaxID=2726742 RepID=A0A7X8XXB2_9BACT|nr:YceI family protein [Flammeovirga agarivorans]NLR93003.1 YceI family protein [Flammeovirga agarivorans]